ncbi:MAG: leucine-rich repeat protein [Clostridiales bacterium]|nr:leucine-rich repeat protein [Clostridiales bacterium]
MEKRTKKRMLSFLLALTMVFSLTATPVLAAEESDADAMAVEEAVADEETQSEETGSGEAANESEEAESGETAEEAVTEEAETGTTEAETEAAEAETEETDASADSLADSAQSDEDGSFSVMSSSEEDAQTGTGDEDDTAAKTETGTETQEVTVMADTSEMFSDAEELTTDGATASITEAGSYVYFKIVPEETGTYRFSTSCDEDTYGSLYDADGTCLADDDDSGDGYNFAITYRLTEGNTYYLGAGFLSNTVTGDFSVFMELTSGLTLSYESDQALEVDGEGTLSVEASNDQGDTDFTYSWYKLNESTYNYDLLDGETESTLTVTEKGTYRCIVEDTSMTATATFYVTVNSGFSVSADQYYYTASQGDSVTFTVIANTEIGELSYKWYRYDGDGYTLLDNTSSDLTITADQSAEYKCVVSDTYNTETIWFTVYVEGETAISKDDAATLTAGSSALATISEYGDRMYFVITPDTTGTYMFYSSCGYYTYGYLYDENENVLISESGNRDGNFWFTYDLTAGETYYLAVETDSGAPLSFLVYMDTYVDTNLQSVDGGNTYYAYSTAGEGVELTVEDKISVAEGAELTYQWYKDGSKIDGATDSVYTTDEISSRIYYNCKVEDTYGNYLYFYFIVTVDTGLNIDGDDYHYTYYYDTKPGTELTLTTTATANDGIELTYDWYCYDYLIDETTSVSEDGGNSITVAPTSRCRYYCRVSDDYGNTVYDYFYIYIATSMTAAETWFEYAVEYGASQELSAESVTADEDEMLTYQWYLDWEEIEGATSAAYTVESVSAYQEYECKVSDSYGNYIYLYFILSIDNGLTVSTDSAYRYVLSGGSVEYTVEATADYGEISYQWYKYNSDNWNYEALDGETGATLTLTNITEDAYYRCTASDVYGNTENVYLNIYVTEILRVNSDGEYSVVPGGSVTISVDPVTPNDEDSLTYQWYKADLENYYSDWTYEIIEGATSQTYEVSAEDIPSTGYQYYRCVVSDGDSTVGAFVYVEIDSGLTTTAEDSYYTVQPGEEATFTVTAETDMGEENLTFCWYLVTGDSDETEEYEEITEGITTSGGTSSLTVTATERSSYMCAVSDKYDTNKMWFYLYIDSGFSAVLDQESPQTISVGESVSLSVTAETEDGTLSYQWYYMDEVDWDSTLLDGETADTLTVTDPYTGGYYCVVSDGYNYAYLYYWITVDSGLSVSSNQSSNNTVLPGDSLTLSVTAVTSAGTLSYQWQEYTNGIYEDISGETSASMTIEGETMGDYVAYRCVVSDGYTSEAVYADIYVIGEIAEDADSAVALTAGNSETASVASPGSEMYFKITPETSGSYTFYSSDTTITTKATLYDADLNKLKYSDGYGNDDGSFSITYDLEAGETYYLACAFYYSYSWCLGTFTVTMEAEGTSIASATVSLSADSYVYDGTAKEPDVTVTLDGAELTEGTDYTASYTDNVNAGTATVTVSGMGDYKGSVKKTFTISRADISGYTAALSATSYTYDGKAKKPSVTVTDLASSDYTVSYSNNTNAGTATVTITGTGNYAGTITKTFTISKASQTVTATAASSSIKVDKTTTITASGTGTITYSSSNTSVVTVSSSGKVTAKAKGTATITVKAAGNSNYNAATKTVTITVTALAKGDTFTSSSVKYKLTSASAVTVTGLSSKTATSATIPATVEYGGVTYNVTAINASAFSGYTKLKTVSVGSKVTKIGSKAFYKCTALTKVTGCAAVTSVGSSAFQNCSKLSTVAGMTKVTSIGSKAFYSCTKLKQIGSSSNKITLAKVKTIGSSAFYKCTTLTYVNLTSTVLTKIDTSAFQGCTALKTFVSNSTKLTTIGKNAFYGDKKLASITFKSTKLTSSKVGANAFKGIKSTCTFKVPSSKISAYKKIFKAKGAGSKITVKKC